VWIVLVAAIIVSLCIAEWFRGFWHQGRVDKDMQRSMERAKAEADAKRKARTVNVPAAQLLQEFLTDADTDKRYKGKYLEISGVVERVGRDNDDVPFVILHAGDEKAAIKIECFFDSADEEDEVRIDRLGKGQGISVNGHYTGRVSNIQVRDCVLVR
jgi:hypothetical protein